MGFMAGFGTAFARQLEIGEERRAQQKADAFKLKYADYISRRDTLAELEREDAKAVKRAEAIAERTGVDRKAIPWIAAQVKGGADDEDIVTSVITGKFDFSQQGGKPKVEMDQQMVDSGMAPAETPEVPEAPQPASNTELLHANPKNPATKVKLSDKLRELGSGIEQRRQKNLDEYSTNEVAANAGVSPEEVQSTLDGSGYKSSVDTDTSGIKFTPGVPERKADPMADPEASAVEVAQAEAAYKADPSEMNKARYDAAIIRDQAVVARTALLKGMEQGTGMVVVVDPVTKIGKTYAAQVNNNGEYVDDTGAVIKGAKPLPPAAQEAILKMSNSTEAPKFIEKAASVTSMISDFKDAYDIVKADRRVLAQKTSGLAQIYNTVINEAQAIAETMGKNGFEAGEKEIDDLVNRYGQAANSDPSNLGARASLFQALNIKMAYTLSRLEGQSSSGQSNKDVDRFMSMLEGARDPEAFAQKMSTMIMAQVNELQQQGELINTYNNDLERFKKSFGWTIGDVVPDPKDVITKSSNPKVTDGYKILLEAADQGNGLINSVTGEKAPEQNSRVQINSVDEYNKLPPGTPYIDPKGIPRVKGGN